MPLDSTPDFAPIARAAKGDRSAWANYTALSWRRKNYERLTYVHVTFADGLRIPVHCSHRSDKPFNWGLAWRLAQEYRRGRLKLDMYRAPDCVVLHMATETGVECADVRNDHASTRKPDQPDWVFVRPIVAPAPALPGDWRKRAAQIETPPEATYARLPKS